MSTEFFNDQWRIPSNENQNKVSNYSMDFDGTNDYIDCGDSDKFSFGNSTTDSPFSLSGWVKPDDLTKFRFINKWSASLGYEYMFSTGASDTLSFIINSLGTAIRLGIVTSTLTSTDWQHWVATYDGTGSTTGTNAGMKIYINGVEVTTTDSNLGTYVAMQNTTAPLKIGTEDNNNYYANGKIDQVSVFDYELSASQVSTLYGGGTAVTNPMSLSSKPIAYYQLGDQSVDNGANLLVPNNSLSDYVFDFPVMNYTVNPDKIFLNNQAQVFNNATNFSFSGWFKINIDRNQNIFEIKDGSNYRFNINYYYVVDALRFNVDTSGAGNYADAQNLISDGKIAIGEWFHYAGVFNGSGATNADRTKLYINGQEQTLFYGGTQATSLGAIGATNTISLGNFQNNFFIQFGGQASNIQMWDASLSSPEVTTLYNNGSPYTGTQPQSSNLRFWYKLNAADTFNSSTSTWTIKDYAGSNDATSDRMTSSNLVVSDLQQTSGFSPYALSLDGVDDALTIQNNSVFNLGTSFTISGWFNFNYTNATKGLISFDSSTTRGWFLFTLVGTNKVRIFDGTNAFDLTTTYTTTNQWDNFVVTYDGTDLVFYINGTQESTQAVSVDLQTNGNDGAIGNNQFLSGRFFDGKVSNIALWNVGLSSTQVTEVYNEGRPSDLHSFSTAPVAWWQLGSNSSFNTTWVCLDEIGNLNAVSDGGMTNDDIVDGVGYSASGLGTSSIDIKGDAPYSSANGLSENMDVLDRTTDVPS